MTTMQKQKNEIFQIKFKRKPQQEKKKEEIEK